jgi:PAS domain S-box-containing protein
MAAAREQGGRVAVPLGGRRAEWGATNSDRWRKARTSTEISANLAQMLARAAEGAFAMASDGTVVLWNQAAEDILGYSQREAIGRPCCDVLHASGDRGQPVDCHGCHMRRLVRNGDPVESFEADIRHKDGRRIHLHVSTLVMPDGGRPEHSGTVHLFHKATRPRPRNLGSALAEPGVRPLSARETEIVHLLTTGATSRAVAKRLNISTATVRNHVQHILTKLGIHSRLELVAYAIRCQMF